MNLLFVNYGDFTTNSLNHIAAFARFLADRGHDCIVAVPFGRETVSVVPNPAFRPATFAELLERPATFRDGRPADLVHAWTSREVIRQFVLTYQAQAHARLVVHLEDNEEALLARWFQAPFEEVREFSEVTLAERSTPYLSHPRRYRPFLRVADGATCIVATLRDLIPPEVPALELPPGLDFEMHHPLPPDAELRRELGLGEEERVIVFTGSNTFANEPEIRDLYAAVARLNAEQIPTRLVRTGLNSPTFSEQLSDVERAHVLDLGFVDKTRLPRLLALADVLVQPGRPGLFNDYRLPSKLPEFLAAGRPVVLPASNVGRELRDGVEALVLKEGTVEEIVRACRRILADPALGRQLGEAAAAFARRRFDLSVIGDRLEGFYRTILEQPPRPGTTAAVAPGTGEASLVLRQIAARSPGSVSALAAELVPLVEAMERDELGRRERGRLEGIIADWKREYQLAAKHGRNLERELEALRQVRDKLQRWTGELDRKLATTTGERDRAAAKVDHLQNTFSWKVTAPLRFLRRKGIDPWKRARTQIPPREDAASFGSTGLADTGVRFWQNLDQPNAWTVFPGDLVLRGWCFAEDGRRLVAIRARSGDRMVEGTYGLKRLDVFSSVNRLPYAEYCGWHLEMKVREGESGLDVEVQDADGRWHRLLHADLRVTTDAGPEVLTSYEKWIEVYETSAKAGEADRTRQDAPAPGPRISVLMPVYNTPARWLEKAVASVRAQTYRNWELCIADDASTDPQLRTRLEGWAQEDPRIRLCFRSINGHIAAASNSALALATGEFIALLDHDDELAPHALAEVAAFLAARPDTTLLYTDEDKIDENGHRQDPYFKPDFLPDLFLAQNYVTHLAVYPANLVRELGGFREGLEGSQDWDLALRVLDRGGAARIRHLPRILYHWRSIPGSTALQVSEKDYSRDAAHQALSDHFRRTGENVRLHPLPSGYWRAEYPLPDPAPGVSLIIPTRNGLPHLRRGIESILEKTRYPEFEILVVDNGSDDPATLAYLARLSDGSHSRLGKGRTARVLRLDIPFNYSAINNHGVREARGEIVGLLNDDLEVINPDWLEEMVSQAVRPGIGCVGAMLLYPNGTIQQAGVILGIGGVAGHALRDLPAETDRVFSRARLVQNYSAVTGACLLVRRSTYLEVGGLDERDLPVAFNDVDLCLRVRAARYRNLWTPFARLFHHESATRGAEDSPEKRSRFAREIAIMKDRWGSILEHDPAYNPNLTLDLNDFSLAAPPRDWRP